MADRIQHDMVSGIGRYESADVGAALRSLLHGDWRFYSVGFIAAGALTGVAAWRRMKA